MLRTWMIALSLALACARQPAASAPPVAATSVATTAATPPAEGSLSGRVAEKIDASQYTYLRLNTASGEVWAAVPKSNIAVGAETTVVGANWMENFTSATLGRTWPRIAFGTLAEEDAPAAPGARAPAAGLAGATPPTPAGATPGHSSAGMFAQQAAAPLHRASTREGRTIAEIYAQRAALKDQSVSVRGRVVKSINGVLGKNWLHLQDGTGTGPTADLAVTSDAAAAVGDVVVATGLVHLDRDLGSGYRYDVLVEDARLQKE